MTTVGDVLAAFREDIKQRYRSVVLVPFLIALIAVHWKLVILLLFGKLSATEMIALVEAHVSLQSVLLAAGVSITYVVLFPWAEFLVSLVSSYGRLKRANAQGDEIEGILARRKAIAVRHAELIEIERKNLKDASGQADSDRAKLLQETISSEKLDQWIEEVKRGVYTQSLRTSLINYIGRSRDQDGQYVNEIVQEANEKLCRTIAVLSAAVEEGQKDKAPDREKILELLQQSLREYREYRRVVRKELKI